MRRGSGCLFGSLSKKLLRKFDIERSDLYTGTSGDSFRVFEFYIQDKAHVFEQPGEHRMVHGNEFVKVYIGARLQHAEENYAALFRES